MTKPIYPFYIESHQQELICLVSGFLLCV